MQGREIARSKPPMPQIFSTKKKGRKGRKRTCSCKSNILCSSIYSEWILISVYHTVPPSPHYRGHRIKYGGPWGDGRKMGCCGNQRPALVRNRRSKIERWSASFRWTVRFELCSENAVYRVRSSGSMECWWRSRPSYWAGKRECALFDKRSLRKHPETDPEILPPPFFLQGKRSIKTLKLNVSLIKFELTAPLGEKYLVCIVTY